MSHLSHLPLTRILSAFFLLVLVSLLPQAAQAAAPSLSRADTAATLTPTANLVVVSTAQVASGRTRSITIPAVEKNTRVLVSAFGFPANTYFDVRVGPFYTFFSKGVNVGRIYTGAGGDFQFIVPLPGVVSDVDLVTVRLDAGPGVHSYNAFHNVDLGVISATPSASVSPTPIGTAYTSTPTVTHTPLSLLPTVTSKPYVAPTRAPTARFSPTPTSLSVQYGCQIISVVPTNSVPTYWDFDAVWVVKNTGSIAWDQHAVDYSYASGDALQKMAKNYDLPARVEPGDEVTLRGDMTAPANAGTYHTVWAVRGDRGTLCSLPFTLVVK